MAADPLEQKRQEAQAAMEGEEHKKTRQTKAAATLKQRELARRAMEGDEHRKRRETREKLTADRQAAAAAKQAGIEREKHQQALAEKSKAADAAAKAAKEAEDQKNRLDSITESEELIEKLKVKELNLSPLRTFKSDMARAVKEEGISIAKIALSEQARGRLGKTGKEPTPGIPKQSRTTLWLLIALLLLIAGAGYWWLYVKPTTPETLINANPETKTLIFTESSVLLGLVTDPADNVSGLNATITKLPQAPAGQKTVTNVAFTENGLLQSWNGFAAAFGLTPPDQLTRTLTPQFMFGVVQDNQTGSSSSRFLIIKNRDTNQAYAGLLSWEPNLAQALLPILRGTNATLEERQLRFDDKLYRNKDSRVLVNQKGQTILFYASLDPQTIILTQNEATFSEVFDRYLNGGNSLVN